MVLSGLEGTYAVTLTGPAIYSSWETRPADDGAVAMDEKEQTRLRCCSSSAARPGEPSAEPIQRAEQGSLQPDWDAGQEELGLVRFRCRHA
jgi:hypothetical protein